MNYTEKKASLRRLRIREPLLSTGQLNTRWDVPAKNHPCIVCFDNEKKVALLKCGHVPMCIACTNKAKEGNSVHRCPICRQIVEDYLIIYL